MHKNTQILIVSLIVWTFGGGALSAPKEMRFKNAVPKPLLQRTQSWIRPFHLRLVLEKPDRPYAVPLVGLAFKKGSWREFTFDLTLMVMQGLLRHRGWMWMCLRSFADPANTPVPPARMGWRCFLRTDGNCKSGSQKPLLAICFLCQRACLKFKCRNVSCSHWMSSWNCFWALAETW